MYESDVPLMKRPIEMHQGSPNVQTFRILREWTIRDQSHEPYQVVIHADRRLTSQNVMQYNSPTFSEVAALVPCRKSSVPSMQKVSRE